MSRRPFTGHPLELHEYIQREIAEPVRDRGFDRRVRGEPRPDHPTEARGWDDANAIARAVMSNEETRIMEVAS